MLLDTTTRVGPTDECPGGTPKSHIRLHQHVNPEEDGDEAAQGKDARTKEREVSQEDAGEGKVYRRDERKEDTGPGAPGQKEDTEERNEDADRREERVGDPSER
ncbi:hypothetical protein NDU88_007257 [Pleurodeles waltl]|uniref:Uncharacterized protein n=1 Tax=Pleurodeles waltl TaxID=8319 RepID=A0AAV7VT23_PLEWA|nr:hypothetical protein NDU88_007257 [Pleurodeles waltl]